MEKGSFKQQTFKITMSQSIKHSTMANIGRAKWLLHISNNSVGKGVDKIDVLGNLLSMHVIEKETQCLL